MCAFRLKKYEGNPILKPNPKNAWEELVTCNPAAWYEDGTFYLLYRAAGNDKDHFIHLGLATSSDGFNFKRYSDKPVLSPTPGNYDAGCCEDPRLVKFDNEFFLTYAYRPWAPGQYWREDKKVTIDLPMNDFLPTGLRWNVSQTGLAISPDLIHWKKLGRITKYDSDNRDVILFPEKINGKFVRFERPMEAFGPEYGCDVPSIWINYSDNCLDWGEAKLFLTPKNDWELKKLGGSTPPLRTDLGWLVLYHGISPVDDIYRVGALLLDINNPEIILGQTKDFILEPTEKYETEGFYNGCAFPTGNVIVGDTLYVYYGGADRYCCVATCSVKELLNEIMKK